MNDRSLKPGWTRVAFGDVVRQSKDRVEPATSGLKRYVAGDHMDTDDLRIRRWGEIGDGYLGPAFHMRFRPGQVLYGSRRTYLRKVAVADFEGITANTTFVLDSKDPSVLLPDLLPFIMQSESFHKHSIAQSKGSVNPYVNFSDLAAYEFALPPLEEQRRIASALIWSAAAISAFRQLSISTDNLRRALLISTFDRLMSDSTVPKVAVGCTGEVLMGRQRAPQHEDGPAMRPYLRVANVFDGYIDITDLKEMNFSPSEYRRYRLADGDILLNEGQSRELVGRSAIFREEVPGACFQNTLIRFRPERCIEAAYAHQFFRYCLYTGRFAKIAKQTTSIAHLGVRRFSEILVPLPDTGRQAAALHHARAIQSKEHHVVDRTRSLRSLKIGINHLCFA